MEPVLERWWDLWGTSKRHRLVTLYATDISTGPMLGTDGTPVFDAFYFGRLNSYYQRASRTLPAVLQPMVNVELRHLRRSKLESLPARIGLLDTPASCVIALVATETDGDPMAMVPLLEDLYYHDFKVVQGPDAPEHDLGTHLGARCERGDTRIENEYHQMVFLSRAQLPKHEEWPLQTMYRLGYRESGPVIEGRSAFSVPRELNRRSTAQGVVGPFVSVLSGQQEYVENAAIVSAAEVVAAVAKARDVHDSVFEALCSLRATELGHRGERPWRLEQWRSYLISLQERIGYFELQTSFGVEAAQTIFLRVPSLRVEEYHRTLAESASLALHTDTISAMLDRLKAAVHAETVAVDERDRQAADYRRLRNSVAIGVLTIAAVPLSLLLAFFGVSAAEIDPTASLFDVRRYALFYGIVGALVGVSVLAYVFFLVRAAMRVRRLGAAHPERLRQRFDRTTLTSGASHSSSADEADPPPSALLG